MSEIKLFRLTEAGAEAIPGSAMAIEKSLQTLIERHLDTFLGIRFLASEFVTSKSHGGRIDTLGIDETNCPVIIEYKRALNENVISQGLFYLNWLMDHRADFKLLVMEKLGSDAAATIEWRYPRLVCIAGDFMKYDVHAIQQIPQNIDLIRYRRFGNTLIVLERVGTQTTIPPAGTGRVASGEQGATGSSPAELPTKPAAAQMLERSSAELQDWYHGLRDFILGLGDDIEERALPAYIAFRRMKTFAYVKFGVARNRITIEVPLPAGAVPLEDGFAEQAPRSYVRIFVDSAEDAERAQPLIALAYEQS